MNKFCSDLPMNLFFPMKFQIQNTNYPLVCLLQALKISPRHRRSSKSIFKGSKANPGSSLSYDAISDPRSAAGAGAAV